MKFDIDEVAFVKQALDGCTIKISDAKRVSIIVSKIEKEFERLAKLQESKQ
tara:strand:+ start:526 stop:678 length:153 start_codon:yes stop_codon:yes gene_type:complete